MKLIKFADYKAYRRAQWRTSRLRRNITFVSDLEIAKIAAWVNQHQSGVFDIVCHGARSGVECDEFKRHFPHAEVFGTDLFPYLGICRSQYRGESNVIEWDFSRRKAEWIGAFDVIYSNSLDHSCCPEWTLKVWMQQLREGGHLFVQYAMGQVAAEPTGYSGDCFVGSIEDYTRMIHGVGAVVEDLLYVRYHRDRRNPMRKKGMEVIVLVAGRKR